MTAARKPQRWILLVDGVFQGHATSAGELMRRTGVKGRVIRIVNEATGAAYRRSVNRRLKVKWRREPARRDTEGAAS